MRSKTILATMCAMTMWAGAALGEDGKVAMVVNGEPISKASLELLISARHERGKSIDDELRKSMEDELITRLVLSQQARKLQLEKDEKVRAQQKLNELAVLSQAYLRDYAEKVEIDEAEIEAQYRKYLEEYNPKEYHVRQILVKNEITASEMIAQLQEGANFAELAKENSIDPGASQTGGDIGWFRPDVFVDKRFSKAVESLAAGEYTAKPVQTRFGWHVIKVEEGPRDVEFPTYEQLSEEWKQKMRKQAVMEKVNEHVKTLTEAASVKVLSEADSHVALQ